MRRLRVVDTGLLTTVQDLGRCGHAHLGVPRAGALDAPAAALAQRLVGNPPDAALLETTLRGLSFVAEAALRISVTGAPCDVRVAGRSVAHGEPVSVPAGAAVVLGPARDGVRSYLAVAGGIVVAPVLGSRSTDTLAWVGPPRVLDGAVLAIGTPAAAAPVADVTRQLRREPVLRLHPGPRADLYVGDVLAALGRAPYTVSADSDRIGLRLVGRALERRDRAELPSEGVVLGAVQVPPDGQPVVFLNDHPTTGGYPVVAVVDPDDLPVCAQARPGDRLTLTPA